MILSKNFWMNFKVLWLLIKNYRNTIKIKKQLKNNLYLNI